MAANPAVAGAAAAPNNAGRNGQTNEHVEFSVRAAEDLYLEGSLQTLRRVSADTNYSCLMLKTQRFSSLFRHYAKYHGLRKDDLQYHFVNVLKNDDTPESVQLQRNDVIIVKKRRSNERSPVTEATRKEFFRDMKELLQEQECSDCVFQVQNHHNDARHCIDDESPSKQDEYTTIPAHKAILTAHSDYFKAFFRKNAFREANQCIVHVDPAFGVRHVDAVLNFMYTNSTTPLFRMGLEDLLLLLQLADLWLLKNLKDKIEDALKSHIGSRNVTRLYGIAGTKRLQQACLDFILRNLKQLVDQPDLKDLMAQDPELFMPVLKAVADLVVVPSASKRQRRNPLPAPIETPSSMM